VITTSEHTNELYAAFVKAAAELNNPTRTATAKIEGKDGRGSYSYSYVGLDSVLEHTRPTLARHGLAVVQVPVPPASSAGIWLVTRLVHESGQWLEFSFGMPITGNSAQAVGSAITYARRYALMSLLGIAGDEDDDGKAANKNTTAGPEEQAGRRLKRGVATTSKPHDPETGEVRKLSPALITGFLGRCAQHGLSDDDIGIVVAAATGGSVQGLIGRTALEQVGADAWKALTRSLDEWLRDGKGSGDGGA